MTRNPYPDIRVNPYLLVMCDSPAREIWHAVDLQSRPAIGHWYGRCSHPNSATREMLRPVAPAVGLSKAMMANPVFAVVVFAVRSKRTEVSIKGQDWIGDPNTAAYLNSGVCNPVATVGSESDRQERRKRSVRPHQHVKTRSLVRHGCG